MTEYFTNNSRPYAENFNDGILLSDAVDLTVKASIPSMYSDESFNSNLNVERLAGVSLVTMVANTGVTVGSTSLSGTGSITFRVYPNFNLFEKWNRISWTGTGDVSCSLAKVDGTPISVSVANGSALASNVELSKLQQVDVTFVLSSASVSDISFEFVASADTDLVVANISQANVTGLDSDLSGIRDDLNNLNNSKEDRTNKVTSLDNSNSHYPTAKAVKTQVDALSNRLAGLIKIYTLQFSFENWAGQSGRTVTTYALPYYEGYNALCIITDGFGVILNKFSINFVPSVPMTSATINFWNTHTSSSTQSITVTVKIIYYPSSWDE